MTLTHRLLSAARHTYKIDDDGPVPLYDGQVATAPDSSFIGYLPGDQPQGFVVGVFKQHAGLVGVNGDGVIVALRGTTSPTGNSSPLQVLIDWIMDAMIELTPGAVSFPGHVHQGFLHGFNALWGELYAAILATVTAVDGATPAGQPRKTIYITGHSKGGAMAALAAWRLQKKYPGRVKVRTFAAARVGDVAFANAYNAAVPDHVRYEFAGDIVPHLPMPNAQLSALVAPFALPPAALETAGYGTLGKLRYIRANGTIVDDSPALAAQRDAYWTTLPLPAPEDIKRCHDIEFGSGYCMAPYP